MEHSRRYVEVTAEFNPAHFDESGFGLVATALRTCGVNPQEMQVHRWDCAIDYPIDRRRVVEHGGRCKRHVFGQTGLGCESAYYGADTSGGVQLIVYDKQRERERRGEESDPCTRLEVRVRVKRGDLLLDGLGGVEWPLKQEPLRLVPSVSAIKSLAPAERMAVSLARAAGLGPALAETRRHVGQRAAKRVDSLLVEVTPSPAECFRVWPGVVAKFRRDIGVGAAPF